MEFSSHQKRIIQFIRDGKITDITSYLNAFHFTRDFSRNSVTKTLTLGDKTYEFDFTEAQTISSDLSGIYDLLFVWQYLRENSLLLEIDKPTCAQDLSVFFTQQSDAESGLVFNKEFFKVCREKIGLKMLPAPEIVSFVKRNYKTMGELFAKNSLKVAWIAVTIALVFLIGTVFFGFFLYQDIKKETSFILNQLGSLQSGVNAINKNVDDIKNEISGISDKVNTFLPK